MLSAILKSDIAINVSIKIISAFVMMRKYISNNNYVKRISNIESKVLEHDNEINLLQESFSKLEEKKKVNEIYFNGQIYDAYSKIIDMMKEAKKQLIIIDSYTDKSVLDMISKIEVEVILITSRKARLTELDINKYRKQYNNLTLIYNNTFHDRYFIIDNNKIYHSGTSLNHAGNRTFSINILEDELVKKYLISNINNSIAKCR